jgi:hypothetical protein
MNFADHNEDFAGSETRSRCNGVLVKAAMARHTKHFCIIFLGLLPAFAIGHQVSARAASLTPTDRMSAIEFVNLPSSIDVQAATPPNTSADTNQVPSSVQALKDSGVEGGNTSRPRSFFLIGLALIGMRLVISHRSKKLKNLATETH